MIITTFILTLTWVNNQPHSWLESCTGSTPKLSFKTMIIIIFIITLTQVNQSNDLDLNQEPGLCPESTFELGFKTILIIVFILICSSWTILKPRVFYNNILKIKNKKILFRNMSPCASYFENIKIYFKIIKNIYLFSYFYIYFFN